MNGTILLTGANGTLAQAIVRRLIDQYPSFKLVLTVRALEPDQNTVALRELLQSRGANASPDFEIHALDQANNDAVRSFANTLTKRIEAGELPRLSAVVCNAFAWRMQSPLLYSPDGYELGFQVTHLAHFLLVLELLDAMDLEHGRIVIVGSAAHRSYSLPEDRQKLIHPDADTPGQEFHGGMERYGWAKLCSIIFFNTLRERLAKDERFSRLTAVVADPSTMLKSRAFDDYPALLATLKQIPTITSVDREPQDSAADIVDVIVGKLKPSKSGYFFGQEEIESDPKACDANVQREIWDLSTQWVGNTKYASMTP